MGQQELLELRHLAPQQSHFILQATKRKQSEPFLLDHVQPFQAGQEAKAAVTVQLPCCTIIFRRKLSVDTADRLTDLKLL